MATLVQATKEEASHKAKVAKNDAAGAADSAKHEARGFGAKLWGKSQVSPVARREAVTP